MRLRVSRTTRIRKLRWPLLPCTRESGNDRGMIRTDAHDLPIRAALASPGPHPRRRLRGGRDGEAPRAPHAAAGRCRDLARQPRELLAVHAAPARGLLRSHRGAPLRDRPARPDAPPVELGGDRRGAGDRPRREAGHGPGRRRRPASAQLRQPGAGPRRRDGDVRDHGHRRVRGRHEDAGRCVRPAQPDHRDARARRPRREPRRARRGADVRRRWGRVQWRRDGGRDRGLHSPRAPALLPEDSASTRSGPTSSS